LKIVEFAGAEMLEDSVVNLSLAILVLVVLIVLHRVEVVELYRGPKLYQMAGIHVL